MASLGAPASAASWTSAATRSPSNPIFSAANASSAGAARIPFVCAAKLLGVQRDGGFAEKVLVPARALVRLPDRRGFRHLRRAHARRQHRHAHAHEPRASESGRLGARHRRRPAAWARRPFKSPKNSARASSAPVPPRPNAIWPDNLGAEFVVDSNDPQWPAEVRRITEQARRGSGRGTRRRRCAAENVLIAWRAAERS